MDTTFQPHEFHEGETFEYLYESTEARYATEPVSDGRIPRITDVQHIDESRTTIRFTIVPGEDGAEEGTLRKQVEFSDMRFREVTAAHLEQGEQVPFRAGHDAIPGLPEVITHTYDLGTDGRVASGLGVIFGQYCDPSEFAGPYRFIDAFTFAAVIENYLTSSAHVGDVITRPSREVEFYGTTYHSARQVMYFDRIDLIDGIHQGFVKVHALGNFTDREHGDSGYLMSAHLPLEGPATGLVSRGELHELIFAGRDPSTPVTATQRQLSFTLQTEHTHSGVVDVTRGRASRASPSRSDAVHALRGAREQLRALVGGVAGREPQERVPHAVVAEALLVDREVALEHAAFRPERLDRGLDVRRPEVGQLRRRRALAVLQPEAVDGHPDTPDLEHDVRSPGDLLQATPPVVEDRRRDSGVASSGTGPPRWFTMNVSSGTASSVSASSSSCGWYSQTS